MKYKPSELAAPWLCTREHGTNDGVLVRCIQQAGTAGGVGKESWCADFVSLILLLAFQCTDVPFPRSSAAQDFYARGKLMGWITTAPSVDDLFVIVNAQDHAHHVGIVTDARYVGSFTIPPVSVTGIAGNTNAGGSDNGDGVYEKPITHAATDRVVYLHYPR